ncbi:HAD superfamily hydrolase (TIGR01459 family) [Rubricella aquisinus]|uniref:HAD superfamily hydrolase (TIGR01459 family) n=1 Tax=Rubricella aquisinus TaxID=2028108 RepID=A0A840WIP9_9RHOB|nr:TIGR01459 family HAD-type hydrolase [Rubricella aquisinus]MBB5514093.1 HAD superfamily hydrolase (TIGR01459 family) [Rubricella aquisinus]
MTRILSSLSEVALQYDAVFCDLWGCLHNGVRPFPEAVAALEAFRDGGGIVVLLTNSPRPSDGVYQQLDAMGVDRALYQAVASSGDAALAALAAGAFGRKVWHIGPDRDESFFQTLARSYPEANITRVPRNEAEGIVCTGLYDDDTETPEDYREEILFGVNEGLKMLCANPDIFVDKGDKRIWCAGGIARAYEDAGGDARYFGKPHAPIYDLARQRLIEVTGGKRIADDRILCIGDGIHTDIRGAVGEDMDSLFVTGGLAREETGTTDQPDPDKLRAFIRDAQLTPTMSIGALR